MSPPGKHRTPKWLVTLLAPIVSVVALEVGFRYRAHVINRGTPKAAFEVPPIESSTGRVRFRDIIRPNPNDRIIFEMPPGLDVLYKGRPLKTNSHGFRGSEYPVKADENTITIVGIGASIMLVTASETARSTPSCSSSCCRNVTPPEDGASSIRPCPATTW